MCVLLYCLIGLAWCDVFKAMFKEYIIKWFNHQFIGLAWHDVFKAMFKGLSHKMVKPSDHQETTADFLNSQN